jgi:DNA polymerase II small subunit/DNA polymerase delta subunit B
MIFKICFGTSVSKTLCFSQSHSQTSSVQTIVSGARVLSSFRVRSCIFSEHHIGSHTFSFEAFTKWLENLLS